MDNNGQGGAPVGDNQQNTTPEVKQQASISPAFVGRSRFGSGRSISNYEREKANFDAAQNIVSNPNTPDFFGQAVMSNTSIPVAPKPNNKKKIFIFGGITAALVAVVVVVAILLTNPSSPIVKKNNSTAVIAKYNAFANYILNGTESADDAGDVSDYKSAKYFSEIAKVDEESKKYVTRLKELYDDFESAYKENGGNNDHVEAYSGWVNNLYSYHVFYYFSNDEIKDMFISRGATAAKDSIEDYYNKGDKSETGRYMRDLSLVNVDLLAIASDAGCMPNGVLIDSCTKKINNPAYDELGKNFAELIVTYQDSYEISKANVASNLIDIKDVITEREEK